MTSAAGATARDLRRDARHQQVGGSAGEPARERHRHGLGLEAQPPDRRRRERRQLVGDVVDQRDRYRITVAGRLGHDRGQLPHPLALDLPRVDRLGHVDRRSQPEVGGHQGRQARRRSAAVDRPDRRPEAPHPEPRSAAAVAGDLAQAGEPRDPPVASAAHAVDAGPADDGDAPAVGRPGPQRRERVVEQQRLDRERCAASTPSRAAPRRTAGPSRRGSRRRPRRRATAARPCPTARPRRARARPARTAGPGRARGPRPGATSSARARPRAARRRTCTARRRSSSSRRRRRG